MYTEEDRQAFQVTWGLLMRLRDLKLVTQQTYTVTRKALYQMLIVKPKPLDPPPRVIL